MDYSFNVQIAKEFGVDAAIIIHNLYFWILKNKANNRHCYDDKYWTYNSVKAFSQLFPFWTEKQIRRILDNAEKDGAIECDNFNVAGYDRTKWYTLKPAIFNIYLNGQMELTKRANGIDQMGEPIPDINTDSKPDLKLNTYNSFFETYNNQNIITHKQLISKMKQAIAGALKKDKEDSILEAIKRYGQAYNDSSYQFCKYKMTLDKFLTQSNGYTDWLDEGQKWINYSDFKNKGPGNQVALQQQVPKTKTKFHLAKSRGDKYNADELEELILNNQRKRINKTN